MNKKRSNMEDWASAFPDWAHLPLDVVHLISEKFKCITDYVRFRAVCSPWRYASLPMPAHHLPHQLPWLMIPYSIRRTNDDGIRLFYDLWESKMRKIHLPETIGKACCASYHGWLLLVAPGGLDLFLLNPLTRARVQLPPFTIPVKHICDGDEDEGLGDILPRKVDYLFKSIMGTCAITKITISADLTDPNCIIMVFFERSRGIFFCKVGDCCWTEVVQFLMPSAEPADAAYNDGSFYLYYEGVIAIYNLNPHKAHGVYIFKPELRSVSKFFLVGKAGLYMVAVHNTEDGGRVEAEEATGKPPVQKIELYQVIDRELRVEVKRISDTSDTTIFYGDNYQYLAVHTDDWDSLDGGCIYKEYVCSSSADNEVMLNYTDLTYWNAHEPCYGIFFAKLDDGQPEPVVVGVGEMLQIWPPPPSMWLQPNCF